MNDSRAIQTLSSPSVDIAELTDQLGCAWGVTCGESLPQYLAWSEAAGIFSFVSKSEPVNIGDICSNTILNEHGVDGLLPILLNLRLLRWDESGRYLMSQLAREYLLDDSPYYVGPGLYWNCGKEIPNAYLREPCSDLQAKPRWPAFLRLKVPHSRNFAPTVAAARTREFDDIQHVADIGGGSGVLAIPLALDRPKIQITLVEVPNVIDTVREMLASYGVERRVTLVGMDVFKNEWSFGPCDGVFFGNMFHAFDGKGCRFLCRKSFETLSEGGKILIHEVLFNENKDGPLIAALWNANVIALKRGARQRKASEIIGLLQGAGFMNCYTLPTAGHFSLVIGTKPHRDERSSR